MTFQQDVNRRSVVGTVLSVLLMVFLSGVATWANAADTAVVDEIRAQIVPAEGTVTEYGIPLSLTSLPQFVEWWYTLRPEVEGDARYVTSLGSLVAPCCDDNAAFKCCCETNGNACNIIRSGKGLASYLIQELDYSAEQVAASVLQWFQFARPDYYIAAALRDRHMSPLFYGYTTQGSCYRGLCETPISQGGCGGMQQLIEPAIEAEQI